MTANAKENLIYQFMTPLRNIFVCFISIMCDLLLYMKCKQLCNCKSMILDVTLNRL